MKKNKMMRIASVLLVAVLLSTCAISGTYAKYAANITASDSALVAKFVVSAFGYTLSNTTSSKTVDLFTTVCNQPSPPDKNVSGSTVSDDANVNNSRAGIPLIAPGTWGQLPFSIANASEVTVNYSITFGGNEAGVPLEWSLDGTTWVNNITDLNVSSTTCPAGQNFILWWMWDFASEPNVDTPLGADGSAEPSATITVAFEQVN